MWLTAVRRRTGRERSVILGYFEDGPNLVTLAMNGSRGARSRPGGSTCRAIHTHPSSWRTGCATSSSMLRPG
jgi:hypothetical protein